MSGWPEENGSMPVFQAAPRVTVASVLSILRLALVPALLALAAAGRRAAYSAVLAVAFATDVADGYLARRLGQASALGARLDSAADLALFLTVPPALALLFPEWWPGSSPAVCWRSTLWRCCSAERATGSSSPRLERPASPRSRKSRSRFCCAAGKEM